MGARKSEYRSETTQVRRKFVESESSKAVGTVHFEFFPAQRKYVESAPSMYAKYNLTPEIHFAGFSKN